MKRKGGRGCCELSTRDLRESQSLGDDVVLKMKMEVSRRKKRQTGFPILPRIYVIAYIWDSYFRVQSPSPGRDANS